MADEYKFRTNEEHMRTKAMWAGALVKTTIPNLQGLTPEGKACEISADQTPALLKIIDEAMVNASDHAVEHSTGRDRVKRISLDFDRATGRVTVENDGPGLPVEVHPGVTAMLKPKLGRDVYVPEVAFAVTMTGRNMDKGADSVKGGVNGLGAKLINLHSDEFVVETVSGGAFYIQKFWDRLRQRAPPAIFSVTSAQGKKLAPARRKPHTRVSFVPAYAELGYTLGEGGRLSVADADALDAWCRLRAHLLAAYVGPRVETLYNGARADTTSAESLAALLLSGADATIMPCEAKAPSRKSLSLAVSIVPTNRHFQCVSVINGVNSPSGTHVKYIRGLLATAVAARLQKATRDEKSSRVPREATKYLHVTVVGQVPGADWGGQRKDEIQMPISALQAYKIPPKRLGEVADAIAHHVLSVADTPARATRKKKVKVDKYTSAQLAGTRRSAECRLLLAEGDSAITLLRAGLTLGKGKKAPPGAPSFELCGVMSLSGVIMNARRQVTEVKGAVGASRTVRSSKLQQNKTLSALMDVLGLDYGRDYVSDADMRTLRYGSVVICTDQDLDGTGKILCLVLVWFHLFWPALIRRGFVKRFMTPVIRVYPSDRKQEAREFIYEDEFRRWAEGQGGEAEVARTHQVRYYKGLASHDTEVRAMFADFASALYTFTLSDRSAELFHAYFGEDPRLRREALLEPLQPLSEDALAAIHREQAISCDLQLEVDAKAYKLEDLHRKLPCVADGLQVTRRKIVTAALRRFGRNNREIKVFVFGGFVTQEMFYHHGDLTLNQTITKMAQRFPGALHFPYLTGIGQFGSRHGEKIASPRYISVCLAAPFAKAMLPAADLRHLPYVHEEGERAQPTHLLPVLPAALLESCQIPSEGWSHKSFARDLGQVLALTRAYIAGDPDVTAVADAYAESGELSLDSCGASAESIAAVKARFPLDVSLHSVETAIKLPVNAALRARLLRRRRNTLYSYGLYRLEEVTDRKKKHTMTTIIVTELPLKVTTSAFLATLEKEARQSLIEDVVDRSGDLNVEIHISVTPENMRAIQAKFSKPGLDAIEEFLLLRVSLSPQLNYFGLNGQVLELGDYHSVFFIWAPLRRDLYAVRLRTEEVLQRLRLRVARETIRYIGIARELDLTSLKDEAKASAALTGLGFPLVDHGLLASPKFATAAELERDVIGGRRATHGYLLNLRQSELVKSALARRVEEAERIEARIAELGRLLGEAPFAGASLWSAEIDAVVSAIEEGERTKWKFGHHRSD